MKKLLLIIILFLGCSESDENSQILIENEIGYKFKNDLEIIESKYDWAIGDDSYEIHFQMNSGEIRTFIQNLSSLKFGYYNRFSVSNTKTELIFTSNRALPWLEIRIDTLSGEGRFLLHDD
jgi:hypothetical protein